MALLRNQLKAVSIITLDSRFPASNLYRFLLQQDLVEFCIMALLSNQFKAVSIITLNSRFPASNLYRFLLQHDLFELSIMALLFDICYT